MLGKLFKNEMKSYRLSLGIVLLAGLVFTLFMKGMTMIPYENMETQAWIHMGMIFGFILILILMSVATQILIVIRFYSTMVGDRGYLTWTLPATPSQHIGAKLIAGIIWSLIVGAGITVLVLIFFAGDYWIWAQEMAEDGVTLGSLLHEMIVEIKNEMTGEDILLICLNFVSSFIWSLASVLLIYMCIAIGQLFGKWRILASIGCYFGIIILAQILSTIFVAILALQDARSSGLFYESDAVLTTPIGDSILLIVAGLMVGAGLFATTGYIFKKHLNLE